MGGCGIGRFYCPPHQWPQLALDIVIHKQLFRQRWLVVEHVNQKAQGTQVIAELVEGTRRARAFLVDFSLQHLLNAVTHAYDRLRGLVQTKHRQNAAHLRQLTGHTGQRNFVFGIAEKNIQ